ncbi:hypothetical protein [Pedobacter sp. Leaf176]|uniref:hypothetical protein n=1 Tax=Pedobacter sp. Leaf176 TaxID=1736286 RepID=UPI0006F1E551|nr:hypothetical protein [Pedobacter sp. Leaf176]KQR69850.1 hypothetical protein ASF92_14200 [Pedobacter sp. Leaf176]
MTGIVISFNQLAKLGCIKDINGEKIKFYPESFGYDIATGDLVIYEIALGDKGLIAVNISLIIPKFSEIYQLKSPKKLNHLNS